jgi:uncharacterized membrane protein YphA (DoxX/SURF4 family)
MEATPEQPKKSRTSRLAMAARILLGLAFFVFGLNGFFHFIPQPKTMPEGAAAFFEAMVKTRYMLPLISGTQTLVGALLLLNCFVPLALALIAPVIVNIFAFHVYVARPGLPLACVVAVLELYLAWSYRQAFSPMLAIKARPGGG